MKVTADPRPRKVSTCKQRVPPLTVNVLQPEVHAKSRVCRKDGQGLALGWAWLSRAQLACSSALLTIATCACALETCETQMHEFLGPSNTLRSPQHEDARRG